VIFHDLQQFEQGDLPGARKVPDLRQKCGGDVIISLKAFPPATVEMIKKHIEAGAVLYRVMPTDRSEDISVDILLFNLNKMHELGAKPWQCILLVVDDRKVKSYEDVTRKIDVWVDHGGSSVSTFGNPVSLYLDKRNNAFADDMKTRTVLVPSIPPRKNIEVERDWTLTLATFPGVGLAGAKMIRKMIVDKQLGDDLLTALWFLTDVAELKNSPDENWRRVRENARKWLGLPDGLNIDIGIKAD